MPAYKILCTKKITPLLVQQAANENIEIIEKEFIEIVPLISDHKNDEIKEVLHIGIRHLVFTSANAASVFCSYFNNNRSLIPSYISVYCLSGKTREYLSPCFADQDIAGMATNADSLATIILEQGVKSVIFFCGSNRRNELPDKLSAAGTTITEVFLYESNPVAVPGLQDELFDGIMFFSPGAVKSFFSVYTLKEDSVFFAIGNTTANAIKNYTQNTIIVSGIPDEKIMMDTVKLYFKHINYEE